MLFCRLVVFWWWEGERCLSISEVAEEEQEGKQQ